MEFPTEQFAHVLLFECPECRRPLASACASTKRSLEDADGHWFNPHCACGWTGAVVGLTAVHHWVADWEAPIPIGAGVAGSCENAAAPDGPRPHYSKCLIATGATAVDIRWT